MCHLIRCLSCATTSRATDKARSKAGFPTSMLRRQQRCRWRSCGSGRATPRTRKAWARGRSNTGSIGGLATGFTSVATARCWSSCSQAAPRSASRAISRERRSCGRTTSGGAGRRRDERRRAMAVTRDFKELGQRRGAQDPAFAAAFLREGIDTMLAGDVDTGKAILRDYIKATVGFEQLGEATGTPPKSLIRMLGPRGNPQARNLFGIIGYLQKQAGVELHVAPSPAG